MKFSDRIASNHPADEIETWSSYLQTQYETFRFFDDNFFLDIAELLSERSQLRK